MPNYYYLLIWYEGTDYKESRHKEVFNNLEEVLNYLETNLLEKDDEYAEFLEDKENLKLEYNIELHEFIDKWFYDDILGTVELSRIVIKERKASID